LGTATTEGSHACSVGSFSADVVSSFLSSVASAAVFSTTGS
jgi:hypothetical protein